jgi:hypothetical protein
MGYLTTFTIYNDHVDQISIDTEKFVRKLQMGCNGSLTRDKDSESFGHGYASNIVQVQRPRHADDHTCYVHMGNTLVEMNPFSKETKRIMENHSDFFDDLLKHMETTVKELKKMKKEQK